MAYWTRSKALIAGTCLLAATNAIVLGGAAYNRSGEPEAVLKLSQRELIIPTGGFDSENSGISLRIQWRLPRPIREKKLAAFNYGFAAIGGGAIWLDKAKLAELGFEVSKPASTPEGERRYNKTLPKDVFFVLEMNGPAYAAALKDAEDLFKEAQARSSENPGTGKPTISLDAAAKALANEQAVNSRLFVVDASLDPSALRAKYRDRTQYAIVEGQVRILGSGFGDTGPVGQVSDLSIASVNVPASYRAVFDSMPRRHSMIRRQGEAHFEAVLAFGKRLEPWLLSAQ